MSDSESDQENKESLEEVYSRVQVSFYTLKNVRFWEWLQEYQESL